MPLFVAAHTISPVFFSCIKRVSKKFFFDTWHLLAIGDDFKEESPIPNTDIKN